MLFEDPIRERRKALGCLGGGLAGQVDGNDHGGRDYQERETEADHFTIRPTPADSEKGCGESHSDHGDVVENQMKVGCGHALNQPSV